MKWIDRLMFWRHGETEGQKRADEALREVRRDAAQARKLTHSLRTETQINHIGARLRLAMEVKRDTQ